MFAVSCACEAISSKEVRILNSCEVRFICHRRARDGSPGRTVQAVPTHPGEGLRGGGLRQFCTNLAHPNWHSTLEVIKFPACCSSCRKVPAAWALQTHVRNVETFRFLEIGPEKQLCSIGTAPPQPTRRGSKSVSHSKLGRVILLEPVQSLATCSTKLRSPAVLRQPLRFKEHRVLCIQHLSSQNACLAGACCKLLITRWPGWL